MIPFVARRSKAGVTEGEQYIITTYFLYQGREACDLCGRPHQTGRQVVIDTEAGGIRAGSDCLHQVSGITPNYMDRAAGDQVNLALRVRSLALGRTRGPVSFETTQEALEQLQKSATEITRNTRHGEGVLKEINAISDKFSSRNFKDADLKRLSVLTDHLAYLKDARENPELHRARVAALRGDPVPEASKHTEPLASYPLETPDDLTADQVAAVKAALSAVSKLQMPGLRNPGVDPRDHETRDAYMTDLRAYYERLVSEGQPLRSTIQAQYDMVHLSSMRFPLSVFDVLGPFKLPCVTGIYDRPDFNNLPLEGREALNHLRVTHRAGQVEFHASGRKHTQEVRTDHPKRRAGPDGRERPAASDDRKDLVCWFIAYWTPDPWHHAFPIWKAHGGRGELLKFPGIESLPVSRAAPGTAFPG
ncbi:hypothetical protein [Deinococcus saxicola]|uniref:hypothetical protein n=1 Tax=Deinococcus saxicola TaxID=249406 RepID=UPI0039EFD289